MGFLDTVKGWFNIGGVAVKIRDVDPRVSRKGGRITGNAVLTTKSDKQVLKLDYKFVLRRTTGRGEEQKTKEYVLGRSGHGEPFDLKKGETKTVPFEIPYAVDTTLKDLGGVLGAIGKVGSFLSSEREEFFVVCNCDVKGAALDPSDKVAVTLVD
jgi:hypothetical protein